MRAIILLTAFRAHDTTNNFQEECRALLLLAGSSVFGMQQTSDPAEPERIAGKTRRAGQPYTFRQ